MYQTASTIEDGALAHRTVLCLHTRGLCGAEQIVVKVDGGTVVLCGQVTSGEAKRLCLECCRHVAGVIRVVDQLRFFGRHGNAPVTGGTRALAGKKELITEAFSVDVECGD